MKLLKCEKVIVVLVLLSMLVTMFASCSTNDGTAEDDKMFLNVKVDEKYKDCKILSVSTSICGQYADACFSVVVRMTDGTVEVKHLNHNAVFLIEEGEPYLGGYGCGSTRLYITEGELVEYLNN